MSSVALVDAGSFCAPLGPHSADLSFWRVRIWLDSPAPFQFPAFPGSLIRSVFGSALRRISCTTGMPTCAGCEHTRTCPYGYAFETPQSASEQPGSPFAPHPFVLALDVEPGARLGAGEAFPLELTLVGRGRVYLAPMVEAVKEMGKMGLGPKRQRFFLSHIDDIHPDGPRVILGKEARFFSAEPTLWSVALTTVSPLRLLSQGEPLKSLDLGVLLRALFRRIGALSRHHCGFEPVVDYARLLEGAAQVEVTLRDLSWEDRRRFSARQGRPMTLGGLTGSLEFKGHLEPVLPFLRLGEFLHVGKGTSFGLGRYRLQFP
jgi:hypothetical protein